MRGFKLATSFSSPVRPALQRNLESFGLIRDQEHGYVEAPYYNGLGRWVDRLETLETFAKLTYFSSDNAHLNSNRQKKTETNQTKTKSDKSVSCSD